MRVPPSACVRIAPVSCSSDTRQARRGCVSLDAEALVGDDADSNQLYVVPRQFVSAREYQRARRHTSPTRSPATIEGRLGRSRRPGQSSDLHPPRDRQWSLARNQRHRHRSPACRGELRLCHSESGSCTEFAGTVTCNLGDLAVYSSPTASIVVTPEVAGGRTTTSSHPSSPTKAW